MMQPPGGGHENASEPDEHSADQAHPESDQNVAPMDHGDAGNWVVARVNGTDITLSQLTGMIRQIIMQGNYQKEQLTPELSEQIRRKALQRLVVEELAYQRALELGITISDEEVQKQISLMKNELGSEDHFRAYLERKGMDEKTLPTDVGRFLAVKQAITREVDNTVRVTPEQIDNLYQENRDQFVQQEVVEISDLVFFVDASSEESRAEAEKTRALLVEELDGDLSRLPPSPLYALRQQIKLQQDKQPLLYEAAKKLEPNAISPVEEIDATLHILKLTGYKPYHASTEEEVRPYLERTLQNQMRQEALEKWKEGLQQEAKIEFFDVKVQDNKAMD